MSMDNFTNILIKDNEIRLLVKTKLLEHIACLYITCKQDKIKNEYKKEWFKIMKN